MRLAVVRVAQYLQAKDGRLAFACLCLLVIAAHVFAANAVIRYLTYLLHAENRLTSNSTMFLMDEPAYALSPTLDAAIRNEYRIGANMNFFSRSRIDRPPAGDVQLPRIADRSPAVQELHSQNLRSADILNTHRHENLWQVLLHLHSLSRKDEEVEVLRSLGGRMHRLEVDRLAAEAEAEHHFGGSSNLAESQAELRRRNIVGLLWYVERLYQRFVVQLVEVRNCDGLSQLAGQIWARTLAIDVRPGELEPRSLQRLNNNLLIGAFFEDPRVCEQYPEFLNTIYKLSWNVSDPSIGADLSSVRADGAMQKILLYRLAIIAVSRRDWSEAAHLSKQLYSLPSVSKLHELARLLEVRALFWNFDQPEDRRRTVSPIGRVRTANDAANAIEQAARLMRVPSFASDARQYATVLRRQQSEVR